MLHYFVTLCLMCTSTTEQQYVVYVEHTVCLIRTDC